MKDSTQAALVFVGIVVVLLGGIAYTQRTSLVSVDTMTISSSAFTDGGSIPTAYTCDGGNVIPPIDFGRVPKEAYGIVLFVEDLDVPRGGFTHWVLYDIDPRVSIEEGKMPIGSKEGLNSTGAQGYIGPCPPPGTTHRYQFSAYAVSSNYKFVKAPDIKKLKSVMKWQVLGKAVMTANYTRSSAAGSGATK